MAPTKEQLDSFSDVVSELKDKGTFAGVIKYNNNGDWLGMVYEKDMSYKDKRDQNHFAKLVFNGEHRI